MAVRKRIGVMIPSSNATCEPDFYRAVPPGVSVHFHRLWREPGLIGDYEIQVRMNEEIEKAARYLSTARPDVLVYACTGGSVLKGPGYDQELIRVMEQAAGVPATTTITAVVEAFRALGIKKVSIATPYGEGENGRIKRFLEASGFQVLNIEGDPRTADTAVSATSDEGPEGVREFSLRVCRPEADGLMCACTAWRALEVAARLENTLGKPVVTANQATIWAALRLAGVTQPVGGFGRLLELQAVGA